MLQTVGYRGGLIGRLIVAEGMVIGCVGGFVGAVGVWVVASQGRLSLTMEGQSIEMASDPPWVIRPANRPGSQPARWPRASINACSTAVAQGPISTGGFQVGSATGSGVQKNFPTVGRVINGAFIEKEIQTNFNQKKSLTLALHRPDFTTASRVAQAINIAFYDQIARTHDAGTIEVKVPEKYRGNAVPMVTMIERLGVTPDTVSKVVINERTGTVIMGENVRIATIAIAHGNLSVEISEDQRVSQPLPLSRGGRTVVVPESDVSVEEGNNPLYVVDSGVSIGEVVKALNALGVSPRDLIAIFQALKAAGALQAELEII